MPLQDDVEATKVVSVLLSYMYVHLTRNNFNGEKGGGGGGVEPTQINIISPVLYLPNTLQILF